MDRREFLDSLREALSGLPREEVEGRLSFYEELIEDGIEEGMTEAEAVASVGTVEEIREQVVSGISLGTLVRERTRSGGGGAGRALLLILGFPLWFPLLTAAAAVLLALYVTLWALVFALWAVEIALWACVLGGIGLAAYLFALGRPLTALMALGLALFAGGLSVFLFYGCIAAVRGAVRLAGKAGIGIKSLFIRKERTK